jgi:hypothetical protein
MNTYSKLRDGSWGVRVAGPAKAGAAVTVTKKSGETKTETIGRVLWTDGKVSLCTIVSSTASRRSDRSAHPWTGCACGSREGYPQDSDCWQCQHDY